MGVAMFVVLYKEDIVDSVGASSIASFKTWIDKARSG